MEFFLLKTFQQVMQDLSFSGAARSLNMSQPAVSQQVARLETHLGQKLFQRVGHEVIPTDAARQLAGFAGDVLGRLESFEDAFRGTQASPEGLVRYAMPESCQWTPHFRRIMAQIRSFPRVRFEISICPNAEIERELLEGRLDFGFVVGEKASPDLRYEKFSDEPYLAVAASKELLKDEVRLVVYPGADLFVRTWARAHGQVAAFRKALAEPAVRIGTLAGAIHAVSEGAGLGIFPGQCVGDLVAKGEVFAGGRSGVLATNPVYLARRLGEQLPRRAEVVLELLRTAKAEIG